MHSCYCNCQACTLLKRFFSIYTYDIYTFVHLTILQFTRKYTVRVTALPTKKKRKCKDKKQRALDSFTNVTSVVSN